MTVENKIVEFLHQADINDLSRRIYRRALSYFFRFMVDRGKDAAKVSKADVVAYKVFLLEEKKLATNSVALYLSVLKNYFRFLERNGYSDFDPTIGLRIPKTQNAKTKYPIDLETLKGLEDHIGRDTSEGRRDLAMIYLAFNLGLRNVELARLKLGDISFSNSGEVLVKIHGKGLKYTPTVMVIEPMVWALVCDYFYYDRGFDRPLPQFIEALPNSPFMRNYPVFTSIRKIKRGPSNEPLSPATISTIISRHLRSYGLPDNYTPHSLRHGTAFFLIEKGIKIHDLKRLMRHKSIQTTQRYLTAVEDNLPIKIQVPFQISVN